MTLKAIAKKLKKERPILNKDKISKIKNGKNTHISTLIAFVSQTEYKLSLNGKKCNTVGDMQLILGNTGYSTYQIMNKGISLTHFNNFINGKKNITTKTLLKWCELLSIKPTLEKS